MPIIKTNFDFINNYDEISRICNKDKQMVYITKDGKKDLVAMSIDECEKLIRITKLFEKN